MKRVVILGAGGAGLSCALALLDTYRARGGTIRQGGDDSGDGSGGLSVTVVEAREQVGGRIGTETHGGFRVETGPATLQESPALLDLVSRVGLQPDLVFSDERASRRYLWRSGQLRRLPSRPPEVLLSDALSVPARLRLLIEPLVPALPLGPKPLPGSSAPADYPEEIDESIASFGRRRLGQRVTEEVLEPFITGVYAGDIARLSMRSALPRLWNMERAHGSLFIAMQRTRAAARKQGSAPVKPPRLCGFRQGNGQLVAALARAITEAGGVIRLASPARSLAHAKSGFRIGFSDGGLDADRVVLAMPPPDAAALVDTLDGELRESYAQIPMAKVVAISLGWPREQVPHPLDGFGFLVPRSAGLRLLGVLFMTSTLPDYEQAPKGQVILRAMYGGVHDPEIEQLDDGALLDQVRRDLKTTIGVLTEPRFIHIQRWPRAIEQYNLGHAARISAIEARLRAHPGLFATGAAFRGVSVPDVLRQGQELGARLGAELSVRG